MTPHLCGGRRWAAVIGAAFGMAVVGLPCIPVARAQVSPDETAKSFELAEGLEATVWATEPLLVNPTNIDIDARGRVWVCEGANYRGVNTRREGDRIVILEDTDNDGKADSQKVFAQDPALASPLGIAVIGNKVFVSLSPNVWVYTIDESGDKPVGKPEIWMTGFEGVNHDHGVHAFVFGPDGRLYFNAGNDGCSAKQPFKLGGTTDVVDVTGSHVPRGPLWRGGERPAGTVGYQQGMAFRCNPDGSGFEVIGYNFRNNFELAVDSFGTVWQSDNDDDGNESVRINYVMEGGDFGYHGPQGHDWNRDNAAFPGQSRQEAHWHSRWPGVVPNMLNTGGGSPTGIVVYEGELLPKPFQGALIHCDPGPNVVRAYIPRRSARVAVKKMGEPDAFTGPDREGAGYTADVVNIVKGKDSWFRPSDVCVAPDGSLFISDWYDPGVGGHQTADLKKDEPPDWRKLRGRIYRIAPRGSKQAPVKLDLATVGGQIAALKSPNAATRALAHAKLIRGGVAASEAIVKMAAAEPNPRHRARAVWLLSSTTDEGGAKPMLPLGVVIENPQEDVDVRIAAFRAARASGGGHVGHLDWMIQSPVAALRREAALALKELPAAVAVQALVSVANQFDGEDRWYLEALGIGATGKEQAVLDAWEKDGTNQHSKAGELIRWRLKRELPASVISDEKIQPVTAWWVAGPFDAAGKSSGDALAGDFGPDASATAAIDPSASFTGVGGKPVKWERVAAAPLDGPAGGALGVNFQALCAARGVRTEHVVGYFAATIQSPIDQTAKLLIGSDDGCRVWLNGKQVFLVKDVSRHARPGDDVVPVQLRRGPNALLVKLQQGKGPSGLIVAVAADKEKVAISAVVPDASVAPTGTGAVGGDGVTTRDGSRLPPIDELAKLTGDVKAGDAVFANTGGANCIACHQVGATGQMLGPPLTTIGQKLSKAQLYEAILKPNAGILMGYEQWVVRTKKGQTISGLKTGDTPDGGITIKDTAGKYHDIPAADVARQVKQTTVSIMPENLSQTMTKQELVDLVEYLSTLKNDK